MRPIEILIELDLLSWSTIYLGMKKGWVNRKDIIDYAITLLISGSENEDIAVIAGGEFLEDTEMLSLVSNQLEQSEISVDHDKWKLAHLLSMTKSSKDEQIRLERLQEIYANLDYPEDMAACSIYSQNEADPLAVMAQVIEKLQSNLMKD